MCNGKGDKFRGNLKKYQEGYNLIKWRNKNDKTRTNRKRTKKNK